MLKTLGIFVVIAGLAIPAMCAGPASEPNAQPEAQTKTLDPLLGASSQGRSYLGVDIQDVTPERVKILKLKEERGVEVTMVDQDAPAGKAGVKEHDVITEFNSSTVESEEQLRRMIKETPPGRNVTLGISRDGNRMNISVQLADRNKLMSEGHAHWPPMTAPHPPDAFPSGPRIMVPDIVVLPNASRILGIQAQGLTRQLGEYFGVKNGEGILVSSVEKGSAADKAGVKAGDVIVKADNEKLTDRSDLARILRNHRESGKINLGIVRDKHEQTLTVEVPQHGTKDQSMLNLDSDEVEPLLGTIDIEDSMEDMEIPRLTSQLVRSEVNDQLLKALNDMKKHVPEMQKSMRDAQRQLRDAHKLFELQKLDLNQRVTPLI
jgi:serine protease Do